MANLKSENLKILYSNVLIINLRFKGLRAAICDACSCNCNIIIITLLFEDLRGEDFEVVELGLCHCSRLPGKVDNETD